MLALVDELKNDEGKIVRFLCHDKVEGFTANICNRDFVVMSDGIFDMRLKAEANQSDTMVGHIFDVEFGNKSLDWIAESILLTWAEGTHPVTLAKSYRDGFVKPDHFRGYLVQYVREEISEVAKLNAKAAQLPAGYYVATVTSEGYIWQEMTEKEYGNFSGPLKATIRVI